MLDFTVVTNNPHFSGLTKHKVSSQSCYMTGDLVGDLLFKASQGSGITETCVFVRTINVCVWGGMLYVIL